MYDLVESFMSEQRQSELGISMITCISSTGGVCMVNIGDGR